MGGEGFEPFWFLTEDFSALYFCTKKGLPQEVLFLMGGEGFEPSKASPADLQSVPFGHSGIHPFSETNNQCSFRCLLYHVLYAHASTFFNASSSATSVKFGCNCKIDAGTSGVTGPKKAFQTASALSSPDATSTTFFA